MSFHAAVARDVAGLGGFLRCETCGHRQELREHQMAGYLANGWPKCCGHTMRWWTQRQIDNGEVPNV